MTQVRKLLSVIPSDLARTRGGAERYAIELHRALGDALPGWSVAGLLVASAATETRVPSGWGNAAGRGSIRRPSGDAISARDIWRQVTPEVDVVVVHGWRTVAATTLRVLARLRRRTALVVIDHGSGTRFGYALAWMPFPRADLAAHQTEFERGISPIRARDHIVARGGVDSARFAASEESAPTCDFLMVGRFVPYKGQLAFLESLPAGCAARLIGPADSETPDYLEQVRSRARDLGVQINFDVTDDELVAAYRSARYTVQVPVDLRRFRGAAPPELMGLTMLEAMACGSVPICPGTSASAEFVHGNRNGIAYDAGSRESLSRALSLAMSDGVDRLELRREALKEARQWTWAGAARNIVETLNLSP